MRKTVQMLAMAALTLCMLAGCGGSPQQQGSDDAQRWEVMKKAANGEIVFQRGFETGEIWAMNADDSAPRRLTWSIPSSNLSLSPNGKKIALATERTADVICNGNASGSATACNTASAVSYAQLYVRNIDGSGGIMLLEEESAILSPPTWSPDSEEIAFALSYAAGGICTIYSINADGLGNRSTLAEIEGCPAIHSLAWSPDGKYMAVSVEGEYEKVDIWLVNVDGEAGEANQLRQLTHVPQYGTSWKNLSPTWSPDGTEIAFTHTTTPIGEVGSEEHIYKINADGSGQTRLTRDPAYYGNPTDAPIDPTHSPMHSPSWSPDGKRIAFVRGYLLKEHPDPNAATSPTGSAIYVMRPDGSDPELIKDFPLEYVQNLDWLPD